MNEPRQAPGLVRIVGSQRDLAKIFLRLVRTLLSYATRMSHSKPLTELRLAHEAAKERARAATVKFGGGSLQACDARADRDRIADALGRAEAATTHPPDEGTTEEEPTVATETAAKPAAKKPAAKPAAKKAAAKRAASNEPIRGRRKNRQTGTVIAVVDTALMTTFKYGDGESVTLDPEKGRWACVSEGTGEVVQSKSFAEACILARTPADWGKKEAKLLEKREKDAADEKVAKAQKAAAKAAAKPAAAPAA